MESQIPRETKCFYLLGRGHTLSHWPGKGQIWWTVHDWGGRRCQDIPTLALAANIHVWNPCCRRWFLSSSPHGSLQLPITNSPFAISPQPSSPQLCGCSGCIPVLEILAMPRSMYYFGQYAEKNRNRNGDIVSTGGALHNYYHLSWVLGKTFLP